MPPLKIQTHLTSARSLMFPSASTPTHHHNLKSQSKIQSSAVTYGNHRQFSSSFLQPLAFHLSKGDRQQTTMIAAASHLNFHFIPRGKKKKREKKRKEKKKQKQKEREKERRYHTVLFQTTSFLSFNSHLFLLYLINSKSKSTSIPLSISLPI